MTTCRDDCNGACCFPVVLPYPYLTAMTSQDISPRTRRWAIEDLTPMPAKEALEQAPWMRGRTMVDQFGNLNVGFYFRCRQFDPETRKCRNYEDRPDPCRGYPWYGQEPQENAALAPWCSFRTDLGRKPEPVPVALGPTRNGT